MDNHKTLFAALDAACDEIMDKLSIGPCAQINSIHAIYKAVVQSTKDTNLKVMLFTSLYKTYNILFPQMFSWRYSNITDKAVNLVFSDTIRIQYDEIPKISHEQLISMQLVDDMFREFDIFRTLINTHYRAIGHPLIPIPTITSLDDKTSNKVKVNKLETNETKRDKATRPRRNIPLVNYKGTC